MNLKTGDYEFNTNLASKFTKDEVLKEIERYFQRYDVEFRKKVFEFLEKCMREKNLRFRESNRC